MFPYDPMKEEDAMKERFSLMEDGEYEGVIDVCESKMSGNGNHMFDMTISVFDVNGRPQQVRDFLVFSPKMMWKIIHCCDSAGVLAEYEAKQLCPELLVGKNVRVKITFEEGSVIPQDKLKGKAFGSKYPDKNRVDDYVKKADQGAIAKPAAAATPAGDLPFDDDVPF